ncbi:hypothetical protein [Paenibacillus mendelii]|uniref:Fur-regulated basic protein FbpA n=1 Tax=Paenibacillus mendelii TaxID=206163 RepID=A0ABV6JF59_9BACL|nr:hypothetical protein [Paenibacillus mendelii]MCQ6563354.1 hypothetical protein [Paenibacillus mendelii]
MEVNMSADEIFNQIKQLQKSGGTLSKKMIEQRLSQDQLSKEIKQAYLELNVLKHLYDAGFR